MIRPRDAPITGRRGQDGFRVVRSPPTFVANRHLRLTNYSGYDTQDLARFFTRGLVAMRVRGQKAIVVTASPIRSRGCADVGGNDIVIAISSPSNFSRRRLARLFEHEVLHSLGYEHRRMAYSDLYSLGPIPEWATRGTLRYCGRAPSQI